MDPTKEKAIGCAMVAGIAMVLVGLGLTWLFAVGGVFRGTYTREPITNRITDAGTLNLVTLSLTLVALGLIVGLGALGYGFFYDKVANHGRRETIANARILSRYAYSKDGTMLTNSYDFEFANEPRFYVRMQTAQDRISEYECAEAVFYTCGEGMYGEAEIQGKWIGKFIPYIG
jgi:F0F1-type ATP synthase membrane subunit c/vacuolar-type H+-ATPase subunit K